jgi:hypothetical protein
MFYIRTAEKLQRTAPWVESFDGGIEKLRRIIIHDDLGICKDLDAEMDALIGTYEDEWKLAVEDPDLQRHFRQFANTVSTPWSRMNKLTMKDERRGAIEMIEERGQMRAADWPKDFPGQKFDAKDLRTPKSEWKWIPLATKADLAPTDTNTTYVHLSPPPRPQLTEPGVALFDMEMTHNLLSSTYQRKDTLQLSKCVLINEHSSLTTVSLVMTRMEIYTSPARKSGVPCSGIKTYSQTAQEELPAR